MHRLSLVLVVLAAIVGVTDARLLAGGRKSRQKQMSLKDSSSLESSKGFSGDEGGSPMMEADTSADDVEDSNPEEPTTIAPDKAPDEESMESSSNTATGALEEGTMEPSSELDTAGAEGDEDTEDTEDDNDLVLTKSAPLRDAITEEGLTVHLQALQDIADVNDNNRAINTTGYAASVDYVVDQLTSAGYSVVVQDFPVDLFDNLGGSELRVVTPAGTSINNNNNSNTTSNATSDMDMDTTESLTEGTDFEVMAYSAAGELQGLVQMVENEGCDADVDYASFEAGNVALISRGTCDFDVKVTAAEAAGAIAVIIYNNEAGLGGVRLDGPGTSMPVLFTTTDAGFGLDDQRVYLLVNVLNRPGTLTQNIIAETQGGDLEQIVLVGAHLDSVVDGPGINDNGSGVAVALELALQIAKSSKIHTNKIRFAFWGAEETGLVGSRHYLMDLFATEGPEAFSQIKLYLNLEMVASSNFVRAIYPAMSSAPASIAIETQVADVFADYFAAVGVTAILTPDAFVPELRERSDHSNFQSELVNIPSSGVITGADLPKPEAFVALFGGEAGEMMAPCYHQLCDDINNARKDVMHEVGDAYAHVLWTYANMDEI